MTPNTTSQHNDKPPHKKAIFDGEAQEVVDALQRCISNAQEILDGDECAIALFEPEASIFFMYSTRQKSGEQPTRFSLDQELIRWIAQQQRPMIVDDAGLASRLHLPILSPTSSLLLLPLSEQKTFLGMLSVQSSTALSTRKADVLSACADQVAMTISRMIQAIAERQEAIRTKASFFSMITHELRAPLNSINGYLELVMSGVGGELNEQQYEFVQRARVGSEHLYALLENLLLISRMDNEQMRLNREVIALQNVIDDAVEEWELSASDQNITIDIEVGRTLPKIYADAVRLQQVLRNLISNALNFTPAGGRITINASPATDEQGSFIEEDSHNEDEKMGMLKLQVRDTGAGIAPEYHTRIFERSFQAPGEMRGRAGGPGLGLAIVKMIVELHGGSTFVESKPGQGSTFTCLIPCILP